MSESAKKFILNAQQRVYVEKPWGHEDWLWNGKYCGKKLQIKAGRQTEWLGHRVKDKVLYVEEGQIVLMYGWNSDRESAVKLTLGPDTAFHVPPGMYHSMQAETTAAVLELSTHHSDKDVLADEFESEPADDPETDS